MASSSLQRYPSTEANTLSPQPRTNANGKVRQRQKGANGTLARTDAEGDSTPRTREAISPIPAERLPETSIRRVNKKAASGTDPRRQESILSTGSSSRSSIKVSTSRGSGSNNTTGGTNTWSPWSLAASVLGSNIPGGDTGTPTRSRKSKQKLATSRQRRNSLVYSNNLIGSENWGPDPGSGTTDVTRTIQDQARGRMREALLSNSNSEFIDGQGRYKRKASPSSTNPSRRDSVQSDILVYVHRVKPTDTVAGVVLMYNVEPSILRKANRLWPNDSIQMRSKLFIPVDQCLVKGLPAPSDKILELENTLTSPIDAQSHSHSPELYHRDRRKSSTISVNEDPFPSPKSPTCLSAPHIDKPIWHHHAYVLIEPLGVVEIGRLPQPKLSYFPPPEHRHNHSRSVAHAELPQLDPDLGLGKMIGEIAKDSLEGLEVVGSAIETFVRRMAVKASNIITEEVGDAIELTNNDMTSTGTTKDSRRNAGQVGRHRSTNSRNR